MNADPYFVSDEEEERAEAEEARIFNEQADAAYDEEIAKEEAT